MQDASEKINFIHSECDCGYYYYLQYFVSKKSYKNQVNYEKGNSNFYL